MPTGLPEQPVEATTVDFLPSSNVDVSYIKDLVVQKGVKYGEGRKSEMRGRASNQLLMETVSIPTLRWSLLRRGDALWNRHFRQ